MGGWRGAAVKLIFENWRKFLTEETDATGAMPAHLLRKQHRQKDAQALLKSMGFAPADAREEFRELGRGAFGVVYEVQKPDGEKLAAKVVSADSKQEIENYKFAMEEKAFMSDKYAKYLPDVKQLITGGDSVIILMELLEPLDPQTAQELFAAQDAPTVSKKAERILKAPAAVAEMAEYAVDNNRILNQMREFLVDRDQFLRIAVNAATKIPHPDTDSLINILHKVLGDELQFQSPAIYEAFRKALENDILYYFDKQIVPVHQPEPGEEEMSRGHWTGPSLEKIEGLFPEAEGLMAAMKYFMQDKGWRPKDIHIGNVMMRPGTNDFVIVDLGLFKRGIYL